MPLKRPVTLAQARRWPAAAKRRESFCARMGGMRELLTGERAARDPGSPINRALAAWDCDKAEGLKREHVSKGIRPMKITKAKVGSETRKNPAAKPEILETHKLPNGGAIRLQKRGTKFDVVINNTGIAWRYLSKGVSESHARATLEMWLLGAKNPAKPKRRPGVVRMVNEEINRMTATKVYAVNKVGMRTPIAVFANRADAVEFGQHWANVHKLPVQVIEQ